MIFVLLFLLVYVVLFLVGFSAYDSKSLRKWLNGIGLLILIPTVFTLFAVLTYKPGPSSSGYEGIGLAFFLIIALLILLPILGYFSGVFSRYFFEKAKISTSRSWVHNILGISILAWPLLSLGVVSIFTYPEYLRQKEASILNAEKREEQRAENRRKYEAQSQAEIDLYEARQRNHIYTFKLADQVVNLKAFKYLSVGFEGETPYKKTLKLWGNTLEDHEENNQSIWPKDIYRIKIQTNIIQDNCPNTDLDVAQIWCGDHKVANVVEYRPIQLGRLAFRDDIKRADKTLVISYHKTGESDKPEGIEKFNANIDLVWRINKTTEFGAIYSDIYLVCGKLPETQQSYGRAGNCYIGFRLTDNVFVSMFLPTSKATIQSDSLSAVRQSLKYWDLIKA